MEFHESYAPKGAREAFVPEPKWPSGLEWGAACAAELLPPPASPLPASPP